jgi:hypothetical protein
MLQKQMSAYARSHHGGGCIAWDGEQIESLGGSDHLRNWLSKQLSA